MTFLTRLYLGLKQFALSFRLASVSNSPPVKYSLLSDMLSNFWRESCLNNILGALYFLTMSVSLISGITYLRGQVGECLIVDFLESNIKV